MRITRSKQHPCPPTYLGSTAHLVTYLRALEPKLHKRDMLFDDPFAEALAGETGLKAMSQLSESSMSSAQRNRFITSLATRTRVIDDFVYESIAAGIGQIVVFGAGLDTRPWRLHPPAHLPTVVYFEIDAREVFAYKLCVLANHQAVSDFDYSPVVADLSQPNWSDHLTASGFDRNVKTLVIMEGFANNLGEHELSTLMRTLFELLPPESRLISTFLTEVTNQSTLQEHCFFPEDPLAYVQHFGWRGQQIDIEDLNIALGRPTPTGEERRGSYIVRAVKTP